MSHVVSISAPDHLAARAERAINLLFAPEPKRANNQAVLSSAHDRWLDPPECDADYNDGFELDPSEPWEYQLDIPHPDDIA